MSTAAGRRPRWRRSVLWVLLLLAVVGNAVVAFYPFRLDLPGYVGNPVSRSADNGLRFSGPGVVARTEEPASWLAAAIAASAFRLELEVRTLRLRQYGPARVLAVSDDVHNANLVVAQFGSDLVVRMRRPGAGPDGAPELAVPNALDDRAWHDIRIEVAGGDLRVIVDGAPRAVEGVGMQALSSWDPTYRLSLGNEPAGRRPWRGEIRHAEVLMSTASFDLLEPEALDVPRRIWYLPDRFGQLFELGSVADRVLLLARMVWFLPIGVLGSVLWRLDLSLRRMVAVAGLITLGLEVGKIGFENRHPSLVNMLVSWSGAVIGVVLAERIADARTSSGTDLGSGARLG